MNCDPLNEEEKKGTRMKATDDITMQRMDATVDGIRFGRVIAMNEAGLFCGCIDIQFEDIVDGMSVPRVSASICKLFVRPLDRRRGIATRLVEYCLVLSKISGCKSLGLHLAKGNNNAAALYRKMNFIFAYQYDDGSEIVVRVL